MNLTDYLKIYDNDRKADDCRHADKARIPNANEPGDGEKLFRFSFGAYGSTRCDVFADDVESAFETAVEWLDDNAPGLLVSYAEFSDILDASAKELGLDPEGSQDVQDAIAAHAEIDLTPIGHTTLKTGQYIASAEWFVTEVRP